MLSQKIGMHVSAAGGVDKAPERAKELDAECFQFFSRSPRGGKAPVISNEVEKKFKSLCRQYEMPSYIHTPYYINFASQEKSTASNSTKIVKEELERASKLGVKYVITHLGSSNNWPNKDKDSTRKAALKQTTNGLLEIFKGGSKFSSTLLLETAAGTGHIIGDTFMELSFLLKELNKYKVGVCLDTAHIFASGYDITSPKAVAETMQQYKKHLSPTSLKLVHANDSKAGLGERKDQHEHIGKGKIDVKGFKALLDHKDFQKINFILETKPDEHQGKDIRLLKKLRLKQQ